MATAQQIDALWSGLNDPDTGQSYSGAIVGFFEAGTTTPKAVWLDKDKTLPSGAGQTQVTLSSNGIAQVFGDGNYKINIYAPTDTGLATPLAGSIDGVVYIVKDEYTDVETIADLRLLTGSFANQGVSLQGYYTAGDGGGGPPRHWNIDTYAPSDDNGSSIIVPTGVTTGAWLYTPKGSLHLNEWGCKGDNSTDDSARFLAAVNMGIPITGKPGNTYKLTTWARQKISTVDIQGDFTITGSTSNVFLQLDADTTLKGVSFVDWEEVVQHATTDTTPVAITNLTVSSCSFSNCKKCVELVTTGTHSDYVGANVTITNNRVDDCGGGFKVGFPISGYDVSDNIFDTILGTISNDSKIQCIVMGIDTTIVSSVAQDQGGGTITNNKAYTVTGDDSGDETTFIQAFGTGLTITNNYCKDLSNSTASSNTEGIYVKGHDIIVSNNVLVDSGSGEASIKFKGYADWVTPQTRIVSKHNIITDNVVYYDGTNTRATTGISSTAGKVLITNNRVVNPSGNGIVISQRDVNSDSYFSIISNNIVEGVNAKAGGTPIGINMYAGRNILIDTNIVTMKGTYATDIYGIGLRTLDHLAGRNMVVSNNIIESDSDDDTSGGADIFRGIFISQDKTEKMRDITIHNNKFAIDVDTKSVIGVSVTSSTTPGEYLIVKNNENLCSSASGSVTDISCATAAEPTVEYYVKDNIGFTTQVPLAYGTTANRPTLAATDAGYQYYDTDVAGMIYWNGAAWVVSDT